ncbi:extracellular solute-binding protein [Paenibacillus sp. BC26]|uniref:extracellular solute-binding protein n=1 Tax=Paenibacillus sp. BC26 TaxID=1881032 RepID=UPI0008E16923|nr:extracellular solute-binding protein [Paenibacillus sp. BC26]SFT05418.1 putative aldouronate transport system substrate-binding protein [Paenibacillus sp. BC26]
MAKKLWMASLALVMVLVVGCSSNNGGNTGTTNESDTADSQEAITYTFGRNMNPNDENVAKLEKNTGEKLADNRWTRLFKDQLNISVDYKMLSDSTSYDQKLKLAMASGDLPDIFQVGQASDMQQLMEAGAVEEIGSIYDEYASDLLKSIIESETKRVFEPVTHDGKIYGFPIKMPSTNGYSHLWIREDWLNKLGLERPKTIEDVYNIATAFVKNDPDGNGKADTLGLEIDSDFRYNLQGLFWAYDAFPLNWIEKDGKVQRGIVQPEMKEPLSLLQKMFKEGLLDKEFGSKDNGKAMESVVAGKTGMFYGPHWMAFTAEKTLANDKNAKWITVPLPTKSGEPVTIPLKISADGWMVIKKGTKHPENLIKMMNLYVEQLFGESPDYNKWFTADDVQGIWWMSPVYSLDPMIDLKAHQDIKKAVADNTTDSLTGSGKGFYDAIKQGNWSINMMFGPGDTPFHFVDSSYPDQVMWDAYLGAPSPTEVARGSSMDELLVTTLTSIIQGKTEAEKGFDDMVSKWNSLGGEQVTEEINAMVAK